ncbi:uncharacterized protein FOMMEDRAFT_136267 [Fomitiporia mediterranea MF3/22]|uniref:uncharacterized protein n=1 Tax=Fomitiporia mediterranea (strain MF3/22) TaxID=694068 RepID=UPI00044092E3|nr:uncharacterized protein FOMMEDRAFT_136267 [Fomitiporia mediterranea MF3/22]EJD00197.1 hypothetical protein FOMMEDRAFT_136267 [Fomitiporia mediterranea MF3/22]
MEDKEDKNDTATAPHLVSEFERTHYYHGISPDPPELLYRSDLESNPFPLPPPRARWSEIPVKTAEGVFKTPLNPVWHTVAPLIVALLKQRCIKYSALKSARFSTRDEDGKKTLGPIVIWISTHPTTTSAENARDASPDILRILEEHKVKGAVVEWYEGSVEKLSGLALMRVGDETNPTYYVRRALTAVLGMPIATREREDMDAQGSVSFFFHENKDRNSDPSARVLGVSNKHVLRADTTVDYQFMGAGAPRQYVRVCGMRRFQRLLAETRALVTKNVAEAVRLAEEIARLEAKPKSNDPEQAEEDEEALETKQAQLKKVNKDNVKLQAFFKEINTQWHDIARRNIGSVDWAPKIAIDVDENYYTRDVGTFELDPQKFKDNFQGNFVDLGNKYSSHELNTMFWPNNTNPSGIKFPSNRMLRIQGVVTREQLANPDCYDENGDPVYIVGKVGCTTDFTVGRYSGLEAYLCDEFGKESIEVAVYNYSKTSGNFSAKGDSGSVIFTGGGLMLAILHSSMPKGLSSHVTYGTPAWWVVQQLKLHYKHADFNRTTFFPA